MGLRREVPHVHKLHGNERSHLERNVKMVMKAIASATLGDQLSLKGRNKNWGIEGSGQGWRTDFRAGGTKFLGPSRKRALVSERAQKSYYLH